MGKIKKNPSFKGNGFEIKQRAQRGTAFLIPTICCIIAAKTLTFKGGKVSSKQFRCTFYVTRRVKEFIGFGEKYLTGGRKYFRTHKVYIFLTTTNQKKC